MRIQLSQAFRAMSGRHKNLSEKFAANRARATTRASRATRARALDAIMEPLEDRQLLSTYYVSPYGSDSHSGTSTTSPWKTINRVNSQKLKAGDKVLFRGGSSFSGGLYNPSTEAGTYTSPITFSTYGSGRATINSGTKAAIDIAQGAGFNISNLVLNGAGIYSNHTAGIYVHIDFTNKDVRGVNINNVEVKNYGHEGIRLVAGGSGSSISDVRVTNSSLHDDLWGGFKVSGSSHNSNKNYYIDHVKAYNCAGQGTGAVTGSGIVVFDVDGATVQKCTVYNNGAHGAAPVGIWAAGSNRVTFQYNESYNNRTANNSDGGGFDFDWDMTNSVMQYNYTHGNDGPGYLFGAGSHYNTGNTVRYNISENDGRKNGRAGIQLWGNVVNANIYNNTVYMTSTGSSTSAAIYAHDYGSNGKTPQNVQIRDNIFYTTGGVKLVNLTTGVASKGHLYFSGNAYYSGSSAFRIQWGSSSYSSLTSWRSAKGQERYNGISSGYQGDPKLVWAGHGGTINNPDRLRYMTAYRLQSISPLINRGVTQPGTLSSATTDFFGDYTPRGGKADIGADEVR